MLVKAGCTLDAPFLRSFVAALTFLHLCLVTKGDTGLKSGISEVPGG